MAQQAYKPRKGLFPVMKSMLFGDTLPFLGNNGGFIPANSYTNQSFLQMFSGTCEFNRRGLRHLVETGYSQNPIVFGIVNKILLAQRNIVFTPYWKGKPYKSKTLDLDLNLALQMLLLTGTVFIVKKNIVGYGETLEVINTLDIQETCNRGVFAYRQDLNNGRYLVIPSEDLIIIKIADITSRYTQMGLSPLQAAMMPIEALREMYIADTSILKNKGVDVIITNGSDSMPLVEDENETFDNEMNRRLAGARKAGSVATSTQKLQVLQVGRAAKDLQMWDGFKIKERDVCNVYQVDSGQFNDPDNKKFSNVQESNKALYNDCVIPFTRLITENKYLIAELGYEIYLDTSNIDALQEAQADRFTKNTTITDAILNLNSEVKSGTITVDIAVLILSTEWGYDPEEAAKYIQEPVKKEPAPAEEPAGSVSATGASS